MTEEGGSGHPEWQSPRPEALPGPDATLEEIVRFVRSADPTAHFRAAWGDEYPAKARAVWTRCAEAYRTGASLPEGPAELMLCLAYDLALGPYLGIPESQKLPFSRWLIDGMRQA